MTQLPDCAVLIPIYKTTLDADELFSVQASLANLQGYDIYWVSPDDLDLSFYNAHFGVISRKGFPAEYFQNIAGYNKLLTSSFFYKAFSDYDFSLICQPDAVVIKPELSKWLSMPYDYVGAPWPNGFSLKIKTKKIHLPEGITCTAFVGNGGLSLRRNQACIELLEEFDDVAEEWRNHGHAEDLFFGFMATISSKFSVPSLGLAAKFSHDVDPVYLHQLTNGATPFGCHAWCKYDKDHWLNVFRSNKLIY